MRRLDRYKLERQELLDCITYQRNILGIVDIDLLMSYDELTEKITILEEAQNETK